MERDERSLFESFVNCSQRFLEFGSGGSTWIAAGKKKEWIISVDSSQQWLQKVADETKNSPTKPELVYVDIGPIREWELPADEGRRSAWPDYHTKIWTRPESSEADFYFVDGRFRVACALQCLLHAEPGALIAVHDYSDRPYYHVVQKFAREIAVASRMSIFIRSRVCDFDMLSRGSTSTGLPGMKLTFHVGESFQSFFEKFWQIERPQEFSAKRSLKDTKLA